MQVILSLQVLTPQRKGPAGVQSLNVRLQALLNPPGKAKGEVRVSSAADTPQILRVGDRVIQVCYAMMCPVLHHTNWCSFPGGIAQYASQFYIYVLNADFSIP